jgi:2C-methyl-D-erythritol 2,4-cyclodiphosphate synthase
MEKTILLALAGSFNKIDPGNMIKEMKLISEENQSKIIAVCVAICKQRPDLTEYIQSMYKAELDALTVNNLDC